MKKFQQPELLAELISRTDLARVILSLRRDRQLTALVNIWPLATLTTKGVGGAWKESQIELPTGELLDALWRNTTVDLTELRALLGRTFPVAGVLERAKVNLLIFPDHSVHPHATRILRATAQGLIEDLGSKKASKRPGAAQAQPEPQRQPATAAGGDGGANDG